MCAKKRGVPRHTHTQHNIADKKREMLDVRMDVCVGTSTAACVAHLFVSTLLSFPVPTSRGHVALLAPSACLREPPASALFSARMWGTACTATPYRACRDFLCVRRLLPMPASHGNRLHGVLTAAAGGSDRWVPLQHM
jgi:hypothetical protein